MKHVGKRILCSLLAVCMLSALLCASASAAVLRSSDYLSSYTARVTPVGDGKVAVTVDVDGAGAMDEIGASEIHIYESTDNSLFTWVESYTSDDYPEMLGSGTFYYDTPITHQGVAGRYYKAHVYFYAAKGSGSDTRDYMTVSKRAT